MRTLTVSAAWFLPVRDATELQLSPAHPLCQTERGRPRTRTRKDIATDLLVYNMKVHQEFQITLQSALLVFSVKAH